MTILSIADIARVCHETNRAYCYSLGDFTQRAWEFAPDWQQKSAIAGVMFHVANPDASPAATHENWLKDKIADGWKYGPNKNEETKEHPCCVPFAELSHEQQMKDCLFKSVVDVLRPLLYGTAANKEPHP